jgi:hypothetical protein
MNGIWWQQFKNEDGISLGQICFHPPILYCTLNWMKDGAAIKSIEETQVGKAKAKISIFEIDANRWWGICCRTSQVSLSPQIAFYQLPPSFIFHSEWMRWQPKFVPIDHAKEEAGAGTIVAAEASKDPTAPECATETY